MDQFNPNDIGVANGNYFALPCTPEEAEVIIIPVPWDATTSYKAGTSKGPQAILDASLQVDLFDFQFPQAWEMKLLGTDLSTEHDLLEFNGKARSLAEIVLRHLEAGGSLTDPQLQPAFDFVNEASECINDLVYTTANMILESGKIPVVLGGDHSVPFGLIKAMSEKYPDLGILHIDAHADLRKAYEGFTYSHASIMYNVMDQLPGVSKLVQVGIRDLCQDEFTLAVNHKKIVMFPDEVLKAGTFTGKTWADQCNDIIAQLPQDVYISFDIDGLDPSLCPNTGTPVPGGLSFNQAVYLIQAVAQSGRRIVGFDLNETAPGDHDDWDANVAARLLFKLCCNLYIYQ